MKLENVNYKMHILYQQHPTAISVAYKKKTNVSTEHGKVWKKHIDNPSIGK